MAKDGLRPSVFLVPSLEWIALMRKRTKQKRLT